MHLKRVRNKNATWCGRTSTDSFYFLHKSIAILPAGQHPKVEKSVVKGLKTMMVDACFVVANGARAITLSGYNF